MSSRELQSYLEQIKNERYAKDVRLAIYKAMLTLGHDTDETLYNYSTAIQESIQRSETINTELSRIVNDQGSFRYFYGKLSDGLLFTYNDDNVIRFPNPRDEYACNVPSGETIKLVYNSGLNDRRVTFDLYVKKSIDESYVRLAEFPDGAQSTELEVELTFDIIAFKVVPVDHGSNVPPLPSDLSISLSVYLTDLIESSYRDPDITKLVNYLSNTDVLNGAITDAHSINGLNYVFADETFDIDIFKGAEYILNVETNAEDLLEEASTTPSWVYYGDNYYVGSVYLVHTDSTETLITTIPVYGLIDFGFKTTDYSVKDVSSIRFDMTPGGATVSPATVTSPDNLDITINIKGDNTGVKYVKDYISNYVLNKFVSDSVAKTSWDSVPAVFNTTPDIACSTKGTDPQNLYNTIHYISAVNDYYASDGETVIMYGGGKGILITVPDYYNRNDSSNATPVQLLITIDLDGMKLWTRLWNSALTEWDDFEIFDASKCLADASVEINKLKTIELSPVSQCLTNPISYPGPHGSSILVYPEARIPRTSNVLASLGGHPFESGVFSNVKTIDGDDYEFSGTYQIIGDYMILTGSYDTIAGYHTTTYSLPMSYDSSMDHALIPVGKYYAELFGSTVIQFRADISDAEATFASSETVPFIFMYKVY